MRRTAWVLVAIASMAGTDAPKSSASAQAIDEAAPIYGIKVPPGYRDWQLIAVRQLVVPGMEKIPAGLRLFGIGDTDPDGIDDLIIRDDAGATAVEHIASNQNRVDSAGRAGRPGMAPAWVIRTYSFKSRQASH